MENRKVALITGGSRGIGAATSLLLARSGYDICFTYFSDEGSAKLVKEEAASLGARVVTANVDVGSSSEIAALFSNFDDAFSRLDALVNSAAISASSLSVSKMTSDALNRIFSVNAIGTILCCREAIVRMKAGSAIVNLSSQAAKFGGNRMSHYAATKGAVDSFTIGFAREAAEKQVRVNAVSPAVIDTDAHKNSSEDRLSALKRSIPLGRFGSSSEVAQTIAWLLSDKASYISGSIVPVTGAR